MSGIGIKLDIVGANRVARIMSRLASVATDQKEKLHLRYGIRALNWVARNFQQEGALTGAPWAKLSPNTILGRRKGSSVVLQDTGELRRSFTVNYTSEGAEVGTEKEYSKYHEYGTDPYVILPKKPGGMLAFPRIGGRPLAKSMHFPSMERSLPKGTPMAWSPWGVYHPGLQVRRMLPTEEEMMPELLRTTITYLKEVEESKEE